MILTENPQITNLCQLCLSQIINNNILIQGKKKS